MNADLEMLGLCAIGLYCFLVSMFGISFAKIHPSFPMFDFPIFIGEWVLLFCAVIYVAFLARGRALLTGWHKLFFFYLAFFLAWTAHDYFYFSALALRNAVMFIYPIFALFTYTFFRTAFFKTSAPWLCVVLFLLPVAAHLPFFTFTYLLLFVCAIRAVPKRWKYALVALVLIWPYDYFYFLIGARTWLVASGIAFLFLIYIYVKHFLRISTAQKFAIGISFALFSLAVVVFFSDKAGLKTLVSPKTVIKRYHDTKDTMKKKERTFNAQTLQVNLYNDKSLSSPWQIVAPDKSMRAPENKDDYAVPVVAATSGAEHKVLFKKILNVMPARQKERNIGIAYNDIIFRVLIWEDMAKELWAKKAIFGVGLGQPQRSHSIEVMAWADTEWSRDGWITPHNSLLHLIYRAGVIGLAIVVAIFVVLYHLVQDFIRLRSWTGILLCSIIVYGLVAANFLLILELPYYAIPFWSICGLTLAYRRELWHKK